VEVYWATVTQPLRFHTQLAPFAVRFSSFDAALAALLAAATCSVLARVSASRLALTSDTQCVSSPRALSRRWMVWGWFTFALCATALLVAKRLIIFEQYASYSFVLLVSSPAFATLAASTRLWCTEPPHGTTASAAPCPVKAVKGETGRDVSEQVAVRDTPKSCSPNPTLAACIASVACIALLSLVGYFWLLATFSTPFSRLHVLPTDACQAGTQMLLPSSAGYVYDSLHHAEKACIAAGCSGLANKIDLSRAWYPALGYGPPMYKYGAVNTLTAGSSRCLYGWVADDDAATWLWLAFPDPGCGERRYGAKLTTYGYLVRAGRDEVGGGGDREGAHGGAFGPSAAYCTGCPDIHLCSVNSSEPAVGAPWG
jgi:hypothetical protein